MKTPKEMTDGELDEEWSRIAKIKLGDLCDGDAERMVAVDREGFFRKYTKPAS